MYELVAEFCFALPNRRHLQSRRKFATIILRNLLDNQHKCAHSLDSILRGQTSNVASFK